MDCSIVSLIVVIIFALSHSGHCEESVQGSAEEHNNLHQPQKRMALAVPVEDGVITGALVESPVDGDYMDKRSSLFRFGKRGSLFRFGKRQGGTLFRFGKRAGTLFRFGRSGASESPADNEEFDKRTLFRFGKRADLDHIRHLLTREEFANGPLYMEDVEGKRGIDSFHWGSESDK